MCKRVRDTQFTEANEDNEEVGVGEFIGTGVGGGGSC
jgi:hypothetical protein